MLLVTGVLCHGGRDTLHPHKLSKSHCEIYLTIDQKSLLSSAAIIAMLNILVFSPIFPLIYGLSKLLRVAMQS